jgi:hypothetical protein
MNRNWERRHPCRRVAVLFRRLAGRDAGAPSMAAGSWPRCAILKSWRLPMNRSPKAALKTHALQTLRAAEERQELASVPHCGRVRATLAPLFIQRSFKVRFRSSKREISFLRILPTNAPVARCPLTLPSPPVGERVAEGRGSSRLPCEGGASLERWVRRAFLERASFRR